ncbi:hypothetical protein [Vibrio harveyi]|uniref:hypothetical protein n=1 Tax=Vibrio harveyi TaxID=669 RepID=UPI003BB55A98
MNYVRILLFSSLAILGGWISYSNILTAFIYNQPIIERDGIMNILSGYGCLLIGIYIAVYAAKEQFHFSLYIGEINKMIGILFFISLILSVITFSTINRQIDGYIECKNLREISTRYSSRTYAKSIELCQ